MIELFKEEMYSPLKEIQKNTNKQLEEMKKKSLKESQDDSIKLLKEKTNLSKTWK